MPRLTYANVTATLALFIALGGGAYAATALPRNSVGTAQIKKNAVTGAKIKSSAVTSSDVKNGALLARDFKAGELPAGATGPKGDKGDPGTNGTNGVDGQTGPRGPANVFADRNETSLPLTAMQITLGSIDLPAGNYVLIAKTEGNNNDPDAGDEARISCSMINSAGTIDSGIGGAEDNTRFDDFTTITLLGTVELAAPDTVQFACTAANSSAVTADNSSLVAIQTESITLAP